MSHQSTISFLLEKVLKFDLTEDRISTLENKNSTLEESVKHLKSQNAEFAEELEILRNKFEDLSNSQKDSCIIIQELPNFESKPCQFETPPLEGTEIDDLEKPGKNSEILKSNEISQNVEEIEDKSKSKAVLDVTEQVEKNIEAPSDFPLELSAVLQNVRTPKSRKVLDKRKSIVENSNAARNEETDQSQQFNFKMSLLQNISIVLMRIDRNPLEKSGKDDTDTYSNEEKPAGILSDEKLFNTGNNCQICEKNFGSFSEMSAHLREHIGERIVKAVNACRKIYSCTMCSKQCFRKGDLSQHHNRVHANGQKLHKCKICSKTFNQKYSLEIHARIHKATLNTTIENEVKNCENSEENDQMKSNSSVTDEKPYKCPACPKLMKSLGNLNIHYKTHIENLQNDNEFKCLICSKSFSQKFTLENHIRIHTGEKPYKCKICSKYFAQCRYLSKHNQVIHTDININSRKISSKLGLKNGAKKIIDLSKSKDKIKAENEPDYLQNQNNRSVISSKSEFKCEICSKCFHKSSSLNSHFGWKHPGEKRLSCLVCPKKFASKKELDNHNIIHTKKFYFCSCCKKNFIKKFSLTMHIKKMHSASTSTTPTYKSDK